MLLNFNKMVEMTIIDSANNRTIITCPERGRKPDIVISGHMCGADTVNTFEVRVKGLYIDNLFNFMNNTIMIRAGYNGSYSITIAGFIINAYVDKIAPDRETIFVCAQAQLDSWLKTQVNFSIKKGTAVSDVVSQISKSLGFKTPNVQIGLTESLPADFLFQGYAKDALHALRSFFPALNITVANNMIKVWKKKGAALATNTLKYLTTPPQYSGGTLVVQSLWNQDLRPGDYIRIDSRYIIKTINLMRTDSVEGVFKINQIKFEFGSVQSINSMTIQANRAETEEA